MAATGTMEASRRRVQPRPGSDRALLELAGEPCAVGFPQDLDGRPQRFLWEALRPAVKILRETDGAGFASEFEKRAIRTRAWLNTPAGRLHRSGRGHGGKGSGAGKGRHGGKGSHGGHSDENEKNGDNDENGDNGQGGGLFL